MLPAGKVGAHLQVLYAINGAHRYIREYLDLPSTRSLLGVDESVPANFTMCQNSVQNRFNSQGDMVQHTPRFVTAILEHGVRVLIFAGVYDWSCNWVGNERFTLGLEWSGKDEFGKQALREWSVDGNMTGLTRSARNLTFATVEGAGHLVRFLSLVRAFPLKISLLQVPYDKPKESLALLQRWLAGKDL